MRCTTLAALLLASTLAACATRPDAIRAAYVPQEQFAGLDCPQLAARRVEAQTALEKASRLQNDKANGDAIGVLLVGIPFSRLQGDYEADVARFKGEAQAIDAAMAKAGCGVV